MDLNNKYNHFINQSLYKINNLSLYSTNEEVHFNNFHNNINNITRLNNNNSLNINRVNENNNNGINFLIPSNHVFNHIPSPYNNSPSSHILPCSNLNFSFCLPKIQNYEQKNNYYSASPLTELKKENKFISFLNSKNFLINKEILFKETLIQNKKKYLKKQQILTMK